MKPTKQQRKAEELKTLLHNNEIAEQLFTEYEATRKIKDLCPLYERNILLHEITKNGNSTKERREITTAGKDLVKMYDMINGKLIFTKILVY